jgi:hypothetical protein
MGAPTPAPQLPSKVRRHFDDGYYAESKFEALKYVDKIVQRFSSSNEVGVKLMMSAFAEECYRLRRYRTLARKTNKKGISSCLLEQ